MNLQIQQSGEMGPFGLENTISELDLVSWSRGLCSFPLNTVPNTLTEVHTFLLGRKEPKSA